MKLNIAVVVPNWNGEEYLSECLRSLEKQSIATSIIVVDNGSSDQSVEIVQKKFPKVELIILKENAGFAGGVNTGIKHAMKSGADLVALFNNDAVADSLWLEKLVECLVSYPSAGIATGKLMRSDKKRIDSTGEFYSTWGMPFPRGRNQIDNGQYNKAEPVFAATGGASLYRTKMLKEVGLFDENFFAYFEDVDISFRAQLAGWSVRYTPNAVAYHHVGGTSGKLGSFTRYHSIKNFILLYNKNMPGRLFWKYKPLFLTQLFRMFLGSLRDKQTATFFRSFVRAVVLMPQTLMARHTIQKRRKLSTEDIGRMLHAGRPPKVDKT